MNYRALAHIEIKEDILYFEYQSEQEITLEIAQELVDYRLEVSEGKTYKLLAAFPLIKGMTKEARDFLGGPKGKQGVSAVAIVNDSDIGRMIANVFFTFNLKKEPEAAPFKIFKSYSKAEEWLKSI